MLHTYMHTTHNQISLTHSKKRRAFRFYTHTSTTNKNISLTDTDTILSIKWFHNIFIFVINMIFEWSFVLLDLAQIWNIHISWWSLFRHFDFYYKMSKNLCVCCNISKTRWGMLKFLLIYLSLDLHNLGFRNWEFMKHEWFPLVKLFSYMYAQSL